MNLRFPLRFRKKRLIEEQDPRNIVNEMSFDSQHGARPKEGMVGRWGHPVHTGFRAHCTYLAAFSPPSFDLRR